MHCASVWPMSTISLLIERCRILRFQPRSRKYSRSSYVVSFLIHKALFPFIRVQHNGSTKQIWCRDARRPNTSPSLPSSLGRFFDVITHAASLFCSRSVFRPSGHTPASPRTHLNLPSQNSVVDRGDSLINDKSNCFLQPLAFPTVQSSYKDFSSIKFGSLHSGRRRAVLQSEHIGHE